MPVHEIFASAAASLTIAPIMSLIDLSILRSQLKRERFHEAVVQNINHYARNKAQFRHPCSVMFGVYSATYSTANLTELFCVSRNIDYKLPVLINTSIVNLLAINTKDVIYSKIMSNATTIKYPVPSRVLFSLRDVLTMAANFVVKKDTVQYFNNYMSYGKSEIIASFLVPTTVQIVSTPIHILAIDMYQHPLRSFKERLANIRSNYKSVLTGRIVRTIPAFCIGGFINDMLRPKRIEA